VPCRGPDGPGDAEFWRIGSLSGAAALGVSGAGAGLRVLLSRASLSCLRCRAAVRSTRRAWLLSAMVQPQGCERGDVFGRDLLYRCCGMKEMCLKDETGG